MFGSEMGTDIDHITLAADPDTEPEVLRKLAGDENLDVVRAVAGNLSTPLDVLHAFIDGHRYHCFSDVAKNPSASATLLDKIVREVIAADDDDFQKHELVWVLNRVDSSG